MKRMLTVLLLAGGLAAACSSGSGSGSPSGVTATTTAFSGAAQPAGTWAYPNGDQDNTRDAAGSTITAANVPTLREAWSVKLTGTPAKGVSYAGAFAANPVVADGVVYLQDLDANVYAISLATGHVRWEYQVNVPEKSGPGPDGVAVANGVVYGDSSSTVFALNAATGAVKWSDASLLNSGQGSFEIQPAVGNGRVYLASAYGSGVGGGVLLALSASTGKELWSFNTVAGGIARGVAALGLGAGGAWETPLVGSDGSVTFGTGNPYQSIGEAISHPSADLYTDSEVNLDAATGKLRWYYQAVPNDFKDYDLQLSPIATTVDGKAAIITGGKMGYVYALSSASGALLWKTPVGVHNGHDNDSALLLSGKLKTLKLPYAFEPGSLGGVLTDMAVADGSVYLDTIDLGLIAKKLSSVDGSGGATGPEAGEIEALNLRTGAVEWATKVDTLPLGATTVANNLVFTTLYTGQLLALNRATGAVVLDKKLPTTTNAPIAVFGNTVLVPAGGPEASATEKGGNPQLVAYTVS